MFVSSFYFRQRTKIARSCELPVKILFTDTDKQYLYEYEMSNITCLETSVNTFVEKYQKKKLCIPFKRRRKD